MVLFILNNNETEGNKKKRDMTGGKGEKINGKGN